MPLFLASELSCTAGKLAGQTACRKALLMCDADPRRPLADRPTGDALRRHGFDVRAAWACALTVEDLRALLVRWPVLVLDGGNTFLLAAAFEADLRQAVVAHVAGGGWLVGSSAGSVFAAPDIAYISDMDEPRRAPHLPSTRALALTGIGVIPHAGNPAHRPVSETARRQASFPLLDLDDTQALVCAGARAQVT